MRTLTHLWCLVSCLLIGCPTFASDTSGGIFGVRCSECDNVPTEAAIAKLSKARKKLEQLVDSAVPEEKLLAHMREMRELEYDTTTYQQLSVKRRYFTTLPTKEIPHPAETIKIAKILHRAYPRLMSYLRRQLRTGERLDDVETAGEFYRYHNMPNESLSFYRVATDDPEHARRQHVDPFHCYRREILILKEMGDKQILRNWQEEALNYFRTAFNSIGSGNFRDRYLAKNIAQICEDLGDIEGAVKAYEDSFSSNQEMIHCMEYIELLEDVGRVEESKRLLRAGSFHVLATAGLRWFGNREAAIKLVQEDPCALKYVPAYVGKNLEVEKLKLSPCPHCVPAPFSERD